MSENYTFSQIADAVNARAAEFAEHVLGEKPQSRGSRQVRFLSKGRLVVTVSGAKAGSYTNYGDGTFGDMIDLYQRHVNCTKGEAVDYAKGWLGLSDGRPMPEIKRTSPEELKRQEEEEKAKKIRTARWLWKQTDTVLGANAAEYLRRRGIRVAPPPCVRYRQLDEEAMRKLGHEPAEYSGKCFESLVFASTSATGDVQAIQQVLLLGPQKAPIDAKKLSFGSIPGAAVKLAQPTDGRLVLAEGPETGLSVWQATGIATWITLGSQNFSSVEIPASVREILIACDLESYCAGIAAALKAARHWRARGREVKLLLPAPVDDRSDVPDLDFNDLVKDGGTGAGDDGIRSRVAAAETCGDAGFERDACILMRDPRDALALWRATGAPVIATVKPIIADAHAPMDASRVIVVVGPGEKDPDTTELARRGIPISYLRLSTLSIRDVAERGGPEALSRLLGFATPRGMATLHGIERLALHPNGAAVITQARKAADEADAAGSRCACLAYNAQQPKETPYDWSPLAGRTAIVAPVHSRVGIEHAAGAVAWIRNAGAAQVRLIEWPLFVPSEDGYILKHRAVPKGYDLALAVEDGWRGEHMAALLSMAVSLA
mgnify:CR=1 FL=1